MEHDGRQGKRNKKIAVAAACGAVIAGAAVTMGRAEILSAAPSARNMVSAASVAASEAAEAAELSFGIAASDDGMPSGGETIVLGDDNEKNTSSFSSSSSSSSYPSSAIVTLPLSASEPPLPVMENNASSSSSSIASSSPEAESCPFPSELSASSSYRGKIIFNEIAWMGSPSSSFLTDVSEGNAEWMELKNISSGTVMLSGWEAENASGKIVIRFDDDDRIPAGGFFLLMRGSTTFPYAHATETSYSGNLGNAGDDLALFNSSCGISDYVAASAGWPAGDNAAKTTMERDADHDGWHASTAPGGTPGAENSVYAPPKEYAVTVLFSGAGGASVASDPAGMVCDASRCTGSFTEGTSVKLTEKPPTGAVFEGWSGACSGKRSCTFIIKGNTDITATFHVPESAAAPEETASASPGAASSSPQTPVQQVSAGDVLIAAVQVAGAASSEDYVKLYNPTADPIDMEGWKLKKRSSTGSEYSLRTFPSGSVIAAGGYFLWANAKDGFAASLDADVSSTETLAADNSIALMDADGEVIDALAWGTGTGQYGEGDPFPTSPSAGQALARRTENDVMVDTENNAQDFILQ